MKIQPYFVRLADTYILGPCVSYEEGQTRVGLSLVTFEVGIAVDSEKVFSFACSGCGAIGYAVLDKLPPGWKKIPRPDVTHFFLCPKCQTPEFEVIEDYVITDENREHALDEIIGQLKGNETISSTVSWYREVKAIRDYANKLLDESDNWGKQELGQSVVAYSEGFRDAKENQDAVS